MYLCCGSTERELAVWPWRIVFLSNFAGSVVSFLIAMSDSMADLSLLHLVTVILQFIWWLSFTCCLIKSPTIVREGTGSVRHKKNTKKINVKSDKNGGNSSNSGKNSSHHNHTSEELEGTDTDESVTYASVLSSIATSTTDIEHPQLCHTCHVIRPLRSKHCKVLRRCVQRVSTIILSIHTFVSRVFSLLDCLNAPLIFLLPFSYPVKKLHQSCFGPFSVFLYVHFHIINFLFLCTI